MDTETAERLARLTGQEIDLQALHSGSENPPKALLDKIIELRDGLDSMEDGIFAVEIPELTSLEPKHLLSLRGAELEDYMRKNLPTAVASDPEGIAPAAKHLGQWIDEEKDKYGVESWCAALKLESRCEELRPALSELQDQEWAVAEASDAHVREIPPTFVSPVSP